MRITIYKLRSTNFAGLSSVLAFVLCSTFFVQAQEPPPQPGAPREAQIPQAVERTLKNGLRVIVVERKNVPLVTAELIIKSGGEVDPITFAGAADMTAELLTKGTRTRTASKIAEEIEFLGGSIESGASWDRSSVSVRAMSDKMDKATAIMADVALNPVFSPAEIVRYKTQLLDELSVSFKQPETLAALVANRVILAGFMSETYSHPLTGTPESIKRITRANLVALHNKHYKADNAILIIAGDIQPEAAFALANKYFGAWAKTPRVRQSKKSSELYTLIEAPALPKTSNLKIAKITVVDLPDAGQAAVAVGQPSMLSRNDADYYRAIVANSVLGGGYSARLNQEIRIRRGLSYGVGSNLSALQLGGVFSARTQTKNESAPEVAQIMVKEFERLATEQIAENELTPRKLVLIGDFARDLETTNGLVGQIGELALYDLNLSEINRFVQNVQNVNESAAREFVGDLFAETSVSVVIAGDAKKFLPDLNRRFAGTKIEVVPTSELDLNREDLRKAKTVRAKS